MMKHGFQIRFLNPPIQRYRKTVCLLAVMIGLIMPAMAVSGESGDGVACANLIYSGTKSSICFSEKFLAKVAMDTTIRTSRRFKPVKLSEGEIYDYPFTIMTGEGEFDLTKTEQDTLVRYLNRGGFLLASAGCSNKEWDASFRREMSAMFPDQPLEPIPMDHPLFSVVYPVNRLETKGDDAHLEGLVMHGKLVVVYSPDGLNDTSTLHGCCCCGGNEIKNSQQVNANIIAYALLQ